MLLQSYVKKRRLGRYKVHSRAVNRLTAGPARNQLIAIYEEKEKSSEYQKYDYRNLLTNSH